MKKNTHFVLVRSTQPFVRAKHNGSPTYDIMFTDTPLELNSEIAEHLCKNKTFEIIDKEDQK